MTSENRQRLRGVHANDLRAEGVAQVVEAQISEARAAERELVAAIARGGVEVAAGRAGEDKVVIARPPRPAGEAGERGGDVGSHGDGADAAGLRRGDVALGVAGGD